MTVLYITTRDMVEGGGSGHCDADHCALWWGEHCALSTAWKPVALDTDRVDRSAGCAAYKPLAPEAA